MFTIETKQYRSANGQPESERDERFDPEWRDEPRARLCLVVRVLAVDKNYRLDCLHPLWWARQRLAESGRRAATRHSERPLWASGYYVELDSTGAILVYGVADVESVRVLLDDQPPLMMYTNTGYRAIE